MEIVNVNISVTETKGHTNSEVRFKVRGKRYNCREFTV